ncbi:NAD(P)-binding protein [Ceraceosorus guamensis]|uniref:NAD(P)-binding protein n=1 Tax=Ceraceosorus guamensis TaxID=1522189 RepID=A0A316VYH6_9BASI|nr:NAD(P)-binding protein [Ceraceosorus guamensis]PWN42717.1 NAD(P)-binding protein [Ceraceosorus guamensis]
MPDAVRPFSSTPISFKGKEASAGEHASIDPSIKQPYPASELEQRQKSDLGHSTVGRVESKPKRSLASFNMQGKVCVVTGAARGLGNLIARTFIESGADRLAILDLDARQSQDAAEDVLKWFEENGQAFKGEIEVQGWGVNVADEESVARTMQDIRRKWGSIDVLVNSAGIVENYPAEEYPTPNIKKLFDINITGSYFVAREAAKIMLQDQRPGSIVLIASMSGSVVNVPQAQAPYNASKAAVVQLAKSLAVEWATRGIRVNTLSPGYMATALTKQVLEQSPSGKELKAKWEAYTPMGRMGDPQDLKGAIVYLASDASAFTTGQDIIVDGGYTAI